MRAGLTGILTAVAIAGLFVQLRSADRDELIDRSVGDASSAFVAPPASTARVYLAAQQAAQTRNPNVWPMPMRSLLQVGHPLGYGQWVWNERGVSAGQTTIRVDLETQLISVIRGGHEIGTSVILYGATTHETPLGRFPILSKAADYHSRTYDAPMPFALRLTPDGVAIHGSTVLSGRATHGCIGVPLAFAQRVFSAVHKGDVVLILRS